MLNFVYCLEIENELLIDCDECSSGSIEILLIYWTGYPLIYPYGLYIRLDLFRFNDTLTRIFSTRQVIKSEI